MSETGPIRVNSPNGEEDGKTGGVSTPKRILSRSGTKSVETRDIENGTAELLEFGVDAEVSSELESFSKR